MKTLLMLRRFSLNKNTPYTNWNSLKGLMKDLVKWRYGFTVYFDNYGSIEKIINA